MGIGPIAVDQYDNNTPTVEEIVGSKKATYYSGSLKTASNKTICGTIVVQPMTNTTSTQ